MKAGYQETSQTTAVHVVPNRRITTLCAGFVMLLALTFAAPLSRADNDALAAKHANMKRFYEDAHPKPPPTLIEIKAAAEKGDANSQYSLADIYNSQSDFGDALAWYRRAAEQGHTNAQYSVGEFLLNGRLVTANNPTAIKPDANEAVIWLGKAANQGHIEAQINLANCYRDGAGVNQDWIEAFKWYALAAKRTNAVAQKELKELTLKMRSDQAIAAQARVDNFVPGKDIDLPEPAYLGKLKLNGISGRDKNRLAIINNRTMGLNEEADLKLDGKPVGVKCVEIHAESVVLQIGPYRKELNLRD